MGGQLSMRRCSQRDTASCGILTSHVWRHAMQNTLMPPGTAQIGTACWGRPGNGEASPSCRQDHKMAPEISSST